jgi:hypothetical protein
VERQVKGHLLVQALVECDFAQQPWRLMLLGMMRCRGRNEEQGG